MSTAKHFFILDPYFLIYPADEIVPLDEIRVREFVTNLVSWATVLKNPNVEVGISEECIDMLKRHPRSILNGRFVLEISQMLKQVFAQANVVLVPLLSTIKEKLSFSKALEVIDTEKLIYEVTSVRVDPTEFQKRLPDYFQDAFQRLIGDLIFARTQQFFPIAAFENVSFLTQCNKQDDWIKDSLFTVVTTTYDVDMPDVDKALPQHIEDELIVARDARNFKLVENKVEKVSLRALVERVTSKYADQLFISEELRNILKKSDDVLANAKTIERAVEALVLWLRTYREKRKERYSELESHTMANEAYAKLVSHDITDESKSVHQDETLRNQRLVRFEGEEHYAYLHVKTTPRIHFAVVNRNDTYILVLGPIVQHLDTAKF